MFESRLKQITEYLNNQKETSPGALYYLELLNNVLFQNLIKSLLVDSSIENKQKVFGITLSNSWRLMDIAYILSFWNNDIEEYTNTIKSIPSPPLQPLQSDNCNDKSSDDIPVDIEYYVGLLYSTAGKVGEQQCQLIVLRSNILNIWNTIKNSLSSLPFEFTSNDAGFLSIIGSHNIFEYLSNPIQIDRSQIVIDYSENEVIINGDAEDLEDLYAVLRSFLLPLIEFIDVRNILTSLRAKINDLGEASRFIRLDRIIENSDYLNTYIKKGLVYIFDICRCEPKDFSLSEILYLQTLLAKLNLESPSLLFEKQYSELHPREILVLNRRYLMHETLETVGHDFELTRERIRQIELKALKKLHTGFKNRLLQKKLCDMLKLVSKYRSLLIQEDIDNLMLPHNAGYFCDKVLNIIEWFSDLNVGFYSESDRKMLFTKISELPFEFTRSELNDYVNLIAMDMNGKYSPDEIELIILKKYKNYGEYFAKGRLTLRIVLSFLMEKYFPEGMDLYEDKNIDFLREKARELFNGFELADNNRAVRARLQDFCIPVGRGVWKIDSEAVLIPKELQNKIFEFVYSYSASIVPVQAVLDNFSVELKALDITNKYYLQGQLKKIFAGIYHVNRDYIIKENGDSIYTIIAEFVKQSKTVVTKRDLVKNFPGVSDIVLQQAVANTKILNMNGYYAHLDNLNITREEVDLLKASIDHEIVGNDVYHSKTIYHKVRSTNAGLFSRIGISHYLQFFYLTKELFPNEYSYSRPFIAKKGVEILDGEAQVLEKIISEKDVTISRIREIAKEVGTLIDRYIEFIDRNNDSIVFKSHDSVIVLENTGIEEEDFSSVDNVIESFLDGADYRALNEFFDYWKLPTLKIKWNEWVLYSVIGKYSKLYKTAVSSNYLHDAIPIVAKVGYDETKIDVNNIKHYSETSDDLSNDDLLDIFDYEDLE